MLAATTKRGLDVERKTGFQRSQEGPSLAICCATLLAALLLSLASVLLTPSFAGATQDSPDQRLQAIDALISSGKYPAAEKYARETLHALEQAGLADSPATELTLDRLVEVLLRNEQGRTPETLELARRSLALKEARFGSRSPERASSTLALGRVHRARGEFPVAEALLQDALGVTTATLGPDHPQVADAQYAIGTVYLLKGDFVEARRWLEKAIAIRARVFGADSQEVARALALVGDCIARSGNFREAIPVLRRAAEISEQRLGPDHIDRILTLFPFAMHLKNNGDYSEALVRFETELRILEVNYGPDSPWSKFTLSELGDLYAKTGNFAKAQSMFERALAVHSRSDPDSLFLASIQFDLAMLNVRVHDYYKALEALKASGQLYERIQGPWGNELANVVDHEGVVLRRLGQYRDAEARFLRAREMFERNFGPESPNIAGPLNHLADLRLVEGDAAGARSAAASALAILDIAPDHNGPALVETLALLAAANASMGNAPEAFAFSDKALALATSIYGSAHPKVADVMISRARILAQLGQYGESLRMARHGEDISRSILQLTARTAAEPAAVRYAASRESGLNLLLTIAIDARPSDATAAIVAADSLIRARAMVLDEIMGRRRSALESHDPEVTRALAELRQASERMANLIVRGPREHDDPPYPTMVALARADKERAERALAATSASFRQALGGNSAGLNEVRDALPEGTALIGYVRFEPQDIGRGKRSTQEPAGPFLAAPSYAALVLVADGAQPTLVPLGSASSIEAAVQNWRRAILYAASVTNAKAGEASYRRVATELRRAVWDPVAVHLKDVERVFVVPDGAINLVNLAALPAGAREYLADKVPKLHYLTSERDLLVPATDSGGDGGLLALSNPDFDDRQLVAAADQDDLGADAASAASAPVYRGPRSSCGTFASMKFEPLPGSDQEATQVREMWDSRRRGSDDVVALSGTTASETAFKRSARGHKVLHLATHGFFLGSQCGSAPGPAMDPQYSSSVAAMVTRENPLLISGLVLAGANHRESTGVERDDGILTAEEIATLDLRGTEWAVLSACDTGMGEIRTGEGVFGLRRAFQIAGARSVIMSLWPVEDESTREWMAALYRHRLVENESTIESVHNASLDLLKARRARGESTHPFYWAGFIAAGDWH